MIFHYGEVFFAPNLSQRLYPVFPNNSNEKRKHKFTVTSDRVGVGVGLGVGVGYKSFGFSEDRPLSSEIRNRNSFEKSQQEKLVRLQDGLHHRHLHQRQDPGARRLPHPDR